MTDPPTVHVPHGLLHARSDPGTHWSTTNVGEAFPGIMTPLNWSLCGPGVEAGIRDCYVRLGALPRGEARVPEREQDRLISVFYGRGALNVNFFCRMGAGLPGSAPDAIARQFLGELPPDIPSRGTLRRLPAVAVRTPYAQATVRRDLLARTAPVKPWWQSWTTRFATLDEPEARLALAEARTCFTEMLRVQAAGLFIGVQTVYDRLVVLVEQARLDPEHADALVGGQTEHAEAAMISDFWALGRDRIDIAEFLAQHGYHGPDEGEVSARVWREDPTPVLRLAERYAALGDGHDPTVGTAARVLAREAAERALVSSLPPWRRPAARAVLAAAASRIPLRGVAKAAFLQALDVARGASRRLAFHLQARGVLADLDDVFFLTVDELVGPLPSEVAALVAERREQRALFQTLSLPAHWQGSPEAAPAAPAAPEGAAPDAVVRGIGVGGGAVEGVVRLVRDSVFDDVEAGDVLVCATTDPSWASVLYLSSALVTDVGGPLSHAAVVARELGVPCVVGTGGGTRALSTGDRVRVDGHTGVVEVLARAGGRGVS